MSQGTLFCTLCGVAIERISLGLGADSSLRWFQEIRVASRKSGLTGVGFTLDCSKFRGPLDSSCRYDDEDPQLSTLSLLSAAPGEDPAFPIHADCWQLLLQYFGPVDADELAKLLYDWFHCTTWSRYRHLRPGHDFGGAAQFQKPAGSPIQKMQIEGYAYLATSPLDFTAELREANYFREPQKEIRIGAGSRGEDPFLRLPPEIVHHIFPHLSLAEIQSFILASSWVARCSSPNVLPQSFWRSRFWRGHELGFAHSPTLDDKVDWRALFFATRRALQDSQRYPGLSNRKRIWKLLEINSSLFDLRLAGRLSLAGALMSWEECTSLRFDNYSEHSFHLSSLISAETKNGIYTFGHPVWHSGQYLLFGSRELYVRSIPPAPQGSKCCGFGISVVSFNTQSYVSGIRFLIAETVNGNCLSTFSLGFVHPSIESFVDLSSNQRLQGFQVAASVHGIKALKPLVDGFDFPWIGRTDDAGEGDVGFGFCCPKTTDEIYTYAAGFDEFKMVSFGLLERKIPASNEVSKEQPSTWPSALVGLWKPSPPADCVSLLNSPIPVDQVFRCMLNMNFGGVRGEKLCDLARVVVHMDSPRAFVSGIAFEYRTMSSMHYGRQGAMESSFLVDGPGGERIVRAVVDTGPEGRGEFSIQLCTNFGRWRNFIRDEAKALRDKYISRPPCDKPHQIYTLDPHAGQTIVGFTAFLSAEGGSFLSLGIQTQQLDTPSPEIPHGIPDITCTPSNAAKESFRAGSEIISFHAGCKAYTSAPLEGLKRIRFSRGLDGRPRKPNEISGLCLEYHGSQRPPKILGQWLSEFDSFDIATGDEVTEIIMRFTKERLYNGRRIGPAFRIDVVTLTGSRGTFQTSDANLDDCITVVSRANRFEKFSEFLWTFNSLADHARIILSPVPTDPEHRRPDFHLMESNMEKYSWMVPEKVFWEERLPDGTPDPVIQVTGYSRATTSKYRVGFSFRYKSGAVKTLGDVEGQIGRSTDVEDGMMVGRIDLHRTDENVIVRAIFTTVSRDAGLRPELETGTELLPQLILPSRRDLPRGYDYWTLERLDLVKGTKELFRTDNGNRLIDRQGLDQLPRSDVLGIWAFRDFRVWSSIHA